MSEHPNPLSRKRVLVTRAPHQASELSERLQALGAVPILIPTIEIGAPESYEALDRALLSLADFDLVAFTSSNAVQSFRARSELLNIIPAPRRIAVVGPSTAKAVEAMKLHVDIVPPIYTAESLAGALRSIAGGMRALLVLAEGAPPTLQNGLTAAGAAVTVAAAYSNRIPQTSLQQIEELFRQPYALPDAVTFTSASTAHNLFALLDRSGRSLPEQVLRASIGPITSKALSELGIPAHIQAAESTVSSLVDALAIHFRKPLL